MNLKHIKSIKVTYTDGSWTKLTKPEGISDWLTRVAKDNLIIGERK